MELTNDIIIAGASIIALIISFYTYLKTRVEVSYSDLDLLYLELLKLGIKYPKFVNPEYTKDYLNKFKDKDDLYRYNEYAYMSWNICETVTDRCKDDFTMETWKPVIATENKLHRKWFDNPENFHKFKEKFRKYITTEFPKEY